MKTYQIDVPATNKFPAWSGTATPIAGQSFRAAALEAYNAARVNSGLKPMGKMPAGTRYGRRVG